MLSGDALRYLCIVIGERQSVKKIVGDARTLGNNPTSMLGTPGNAGGKVKLIVAILKHKNDTLTAKTASHTFPKSWGKGIMAGVTNLKTDNPGVTWRGITGDMAIKDLKLGFGLRSWSP